jgi:hypothetical protein
MNTPLPPIPAPDDFEDGVRLKLTLARVAPVPVPDAFENSVLHAIREGGPAPTPASWIKPLLLTLALVSIAVVGYFILRMPEQQQVVGGAGTPVVDTLIIPGRLEPSRQPQQPVKVRESRQRRRHGVAGY